MTTRKKTSVLPIYLVGFVWLGYALLFPLHRASDYLICAGLSLGKRQGLCLLYPAACFLCYLPMVFWIYNYTALFHCAMTALPALGGNVLGWLCRRRAAGQTS